MPLNALDAYIGLDATALKLQSRRMELLAKNLANADTPGYKAQDIDFRAALAAAAGSTGAGTMAGSTAVGPLSLATTDPQHLGGAGGASADPQLKYRVPLAPALDGNTVDEQLEQAAFAENTVRYQASLTFLTTKLRDLMTAITGS